MVVSWVAEALLERLIGPYVKKNERKLDLSGGTMVIRGVELRPDVFDSLGLPVTVRGGEVGEGAQVCLLDGILPGDGLGSGGKCPWGRGLATWTLSQRIGMYLLW